MSRKNSCSGVREGAHARAQRPFVPLNEEARESRRAEPVGLSRHFTIAKGLEAIVGSCLRHFELNRPLVVEARDAEALHQARVAIRRLRSALAMFSPVISGPELSRMKEELRWLVGEFGEARNLDVYLERSLSRDQREFAQLRRKEAYDRASRAMTSARSMKLFLDLPMWITRGNWRRNSSASKMLGPFLDRRIDRLWAKVSDSGRIARMNDRRRHRLRIRVKKLRYALEFAETLHCHRKRRKRKFNKAVKEAQQSLGNLHDIVAARSVMMFNASLATEQPSAKHEKRLAREADHSIDRLRRAGRYWH